MTGSNATPDSNVMFNTNVTGANSKITNQSTITITNGANGQSATRPQSVWYTVSASRTVGTNTGASTTQQLYMPTADKNNNIFAITHNKIPEAVENGNGRVRWSEGNNSNISTNVYTTAVRGHKLEMEQQILELRWKLQQLL